MPDEKKSLSEGTKRRIADDTQMIFMAKTMERLYGKEVLDEFIACRRREQEKRWQKKSEESGRNDPGYLKCLFNPDAHEYEIIRDEPDCLEVIVTRCVHAEVFRSYNASELGEKLICSGDFATVAGYNPDMEIVRPGTCMTGKNCHFIFRMKRKSFPAS